MCVHNEHVARDDCVASDVKMTLAGAPAYDKYGALVYRSFEDQMKEDELHDVLTLNRQRAIILTLDSYAAFLKQLKEKKLQLKRSKLTTLRQDAIIFADETKQLKRTIAEIQKDGKKWEKEKKKREKAKEKKKQENDKPSGARKQSILSTRKPASSSSLSSSSTSKPTLKRKREPDDTEREKPS